MADLGKALTLIFLAWTKEKVAVCPPGSADSAHYLYCREEVGEVSASADDVTRPALSATRLFIGRAPLRVPTSPVLSEIEIAAYKLHCLETRAKADHYLSLTRFQNAL